MRCAALLLATVLGGCSLGDLPSIRAQYPKSWDCTYQRPEGAAAGKLKCTFEAEVDVRAEGRMVL